ncbi:MAG: type transport system ATP-binding protein [Thermoplasmata archaeon]|jgi:ABC-2 type transport system ATP-binding protein|nr:type transport system ATP-binding protein [Thermoplasmata archaeon]
MPEALVSIQGLGRRYGDQWAIRDLTFEVRRGEIFGLIGPNGAGKSTTIKILAGLLAPTEGQAMVGGLRSDDPRHKARIGYLPEESPLYEDMTALAYLRFFARLYEVPKAEANRRIHAALDALELDAEAREKKKIGDMSKGMRRKVAIARSLVNDPDLVIYDEPASGLDPVASAYILDLVRGLAKQGKTVVFSAHNLFHMERICDRVLILRRGAIVAQGSMKEIRAATRGTQFVATVSVPIQGAAPGEHGFETTLENIEDVKGIEARAVAAGGRLVDVRTKELTLEEIFLRTTSAKA